MRKFWRDRVYADRKISISEEERAARSARMKRLNARMRDDEKLAAKRVRGMRRVRRSAEYRAIQAAVMRDIMSRPEMRRAARYHAIRINKNPRVRKRQWASRRRNKARVDLELRAPER